MLSLELKVLTIKLRWFEHHDLLDEFIPKINSFKLIKTLNKNLQIVHNNPMLILHCKIDYNMSDLGNQMMFRILLISHSFHINLALRS
jgi:hypothetical protein